MDCETYLFDLKTKFLKIDPKDYALIYSGGKDSHLLYWFLKVWLKENDLEMYQKYKDIVVVSVNTYREHIEIRKRIYQNSDVVLYPIYKPQELKQKFGIPCVSKTQDEFIQRYQQGSRTENTLNYVFGLNGTKFRCSKLGKKLALENKFKVSNKCCYYSKELPISRYCKENNKKQILGVMGDESISRKAKYNSCFSSKGKFTPLWDLNKELEDKIYEKYQIEIPNVYKVISRTGCVGCPYGRNCAKELKILPKNQQKFCIDYFYESYLVKGIIVENIFGTEIKEK